jgi:hypothetical protein
MDFPHNQEDRYKTLLHFVLYRLHLIHMVMARKELVFPEVMLALQGHAEF